MRLLRQFEDDERASNTVFSYYICNGLCHPLRDGSDSSAAKCSTLCTGFSCSLLHLGTWFIRATRLNQNSRASQVIKTKTVTWKSDQRPHGAGWSCPWVSYNKWLFSHYTQPFLFTVDIKYWLGQLYVFFMQLCYYWAGRSCKAVLIQMPPIVSLHDA